VTRTAGARSLCEAGKGWNPFTFSSSLHDCFRNNTWTVRYKRILPEKSCIDSQIISRGGAWISNDTSTDWVNVRLSGLSVTVKQTVAVRCTRWGR
jgi:hypothetical protein